MENLDLQNYAGQPASVKPIPSYEEVTGSSPYHPSQPILRPSADFILAPSGNNPVTIGGENINSLPYLPGSMGTPSFERRTTQPWQRLWKKGSQPQYNVVFNPEIGYEVMDTAIFPEYKPTRGGIISRTRGEDKIELFRTPPVGQGEAPGGDLVLHPNQNSPDRLWDKEAARREIKKAQSAGYLYQSDAPRTVKGDPNLPITVSPWGETKNGLFNTNTGQYENNWQYPSPFAGGEIDPQQQSINLLDAALTQMREKPSGERTAHSIITIGRRGADESQRPTGGIKNSGQPLSIGIRQYQRDPNQVLESMIQALGGKTQVQMEWEKALIQGEQVKKDREISREEWERIQEAKNNPDPTQKTISSDLPLNPVVAHDLISNKKFRKEDIAGINPRYVPNEWDRWNMVTNPVMKSQHKAGINYQFTPTKDGQGIRVIQSIIEPTGLPNPETGKYQAINAWQDPITGVLRTPVSPSTGQPYNMGDNIHYKLPLNEDDRLRAIRQVQVPGSGKYNPETKQIQLPQSELNKLGLGEIRPVGGSQEARQAQANLLALENKFTLPGGIPKLISISDLQGNDTGERMIVTGATHLAKEEGKRPLEQLTQEGRDHLYTMAKQYAISQKNPLVSNPEILKIIPQQGVPTVHVEGLQTMRQFLGGSKRGEAGLYELQMESGYGIKDLSPAQLEALKWNSDPSSAAQTALDAELALGNPKITQSGQIYAPNVDSEYAPTYLPERKGLSRHINPDGSRDAVILPPTGERTYALQELVSNYPELDTNKGGRNTLVSEQSAVIDSQRDVDTSLYNPIESLQGSVRIDTNQADTASESNAIQKIARDLLDTELNARSSAAPVDFQPVVNSGEFRSITQGLPGIPLPESAIQRPSIRIKKGELSEQIARNNQLAKWNQEDYSQKLNAARSQVRDAAAQLSDNIPMPRIEGGQLLPDNTILPDEAAHQVALNSPDWDDALDMPTQELNKVIQGMRNTEKQILSQFNPETISRGEIKQIQSRGQVENVINQARNLGWKPDSSSQMAGAGTMVKDASDYLDNYVLNRTSQRKAAQEAKMQYQPGGELFGWDSVEGLPPSEMAEQAASKKIVNTLKFKEALDQRPQWFQSWDTDKAQIGHKAALSKLHETLRQAFPMRR